MKQQGKKTRKKKNQKVGKKKKNKNNRKRKKIFKWRKGSVLVLFCLHD